MAAWAAMKLVALRRRDDTRPGIVGIARLDRRTARLAGKLAAGEIAVIDHVDLDLVTAEALAAAKPRAVLNAQPSISGRYPNLGPELLVQRGIPLVDGLGAEIFAAVKDGGKVRIDGDTVYVGEEEVATGVEQSIKTVHTAMDAAKSGLSAQLEAFAVTTAEFMAQERAMLLDGVGIPDVRTYFRGRHALVVVRGHDYQKDLKALKHYIHEYKPVLIGVDGGADALLDAGHKPDLIVGDMDAVSDAALATGAEVVVHAHPDGRAPGMLRVQDLGIDALTFPTAGTAEDAAMLIANERGAALVVSVGGHANLNEFLDRGRNGMASTFLTRLRLGATYADGKTVAKLYRNRISGAALLMLVLAALVTIVVALAVSDIGRTYLHNFEDGWHSGLAWIRDLFT
jgi:uncharacterized membrane-anchored protein